VTALLGAALGFAALGRGAVVTAQTSVEPSNVVLVFDVSNSILFSTDGTNTEFAAALNGIADRVHVVAKDLASGNAQISFEVFGRTAIPYPSNCQRLDLHNNPPAITRFEACLRSIAHEYAAGPNAPVRKKVNTADTDHVAALDEAAKLLPKTSSREAVVFFTDGHNDPPGTARDNEDVVKLVTPAYAGRSPLAILPVGLGAGAGAFESELQAIYTAFLRDMEPCPGRQAFSWPTVIFPSADQAGTAVALALQEVTCSFTVAPTPVPSVSPTELPVSPPPSAPVPTTALPPTPVPTPVPVVVTPACTGDFVSCNPWVPWVGLLVVLVAIVGGAVLLWRLYLARNRVWITAQVDGGDNRSIGWGPEVGIRLERGPDGAWIAVKSTSEFSAIRARYRGEQRFVVTQKTGAREVHQGDPTTVRDLEGNRHQLILRRYLRKTTETGAVRSSGDRPMSPAAEAAAAAPPARDPELEARLNGDKPSLEPDAPITLIPPAEDAP